MTNRKELFLSTATEQDEETQAFQEVICVNPCQIINVVIFFLESVINKPHSIQQSHVHRNSLQKHNYTVGKKYMQI